jgi:hypothetical protein
MNLAQRICLRFVTSIYELLEILHLYQEYCPQPGAEIFKRSQEIDFDFLVTDLPKILESMQVGAKRIKTTDEHRCRRATPSHLIHPYYFFAFFAP